MGFSEEGYTHHVVAIERALLGLAFGVGEVHFRRVEGIVNIQLLVFSFVSRSFCIDILLSLFAWRGRLGGWTRAAA